uniref:RNase H domain-containing protein n=1 Tax=Strongyloides stercoralis TaxID=6248 RepID=A0A0K0ENL9_STRER
MWNRVFYNKGYSKLLSDLLKLPRNVKPTRTASIKSYFMKKSEKDLSNQVYISFLDYHNNSKWKKGKYVVYWPSYPSYNAIGNGHNTKIYHNISYRCYLSGLIYAMIRGIYNLKLKHISIVTDSQVLKFLIEKQLDYLEDNGILHYYEGEDESSRNFDLIKIICMLRKEIKLSCVLKKLTNSNNFNIPTFKILQHYEDIKLRKKEVVKRYENLVYGKKQTWYYINEKKEKIGSKESYYIFHPSIYKLLHKNTTRNAPVYYVCGVFYKKSMHGYIMKSIFQSFEDKVCIINSIIQEEARIKIVKLTSIVNCLETAIVLGKSEIIIVHDINFLSYGLENDWTNESGEPLPYKEFYHQIIELLSIINVDFIFYDIYRNSPSFLFLKTLSTAFYKNDFRRCEIE